MGAVNLILIVQSIQEFVTHKGSDVNNFHLPSIIAVCVAFCKRLRWKDGRSVLTIRCQAGFVPVLLHHPVEELSGAGALGGSPK
jgi:hypothetical protein